MALALPAVLAFFMSIEDLPLLIQFSLQIIDLYTKYYKAKYGFNITFARCSVVSRRSGMAHKLRRAADTHLCPRPYARL
jgi:hypothetical protein